MDDHLLKESDALTQKIRVLEEENSDLSERAEESLLLGMVAENIQNLTDQNEIIETALERISILKNIPYVTCGELVGNKLNPFACYAAFSDQSNIGYPILLQKEIIDELIYGAVVVKDSNHLVCNFHKEVFRPSTVAVIPFKSKAISNGLFVFMDDDISFDRLTPMLILLNQVVDMTVGKFENQFLQKELERANKELEYRVEKRTIELTTANRSLEKEIAERKQAEDALKKSEEKFRNLVENLAEGIYSLDQRGVITYINPAIEKILGYGSSEITSRPFTDFVYEEDLEYQKERFKKLLSGSISSDEYRLLNKKGGIRWVRSSTRPILSEDKHIGFEGVLFDITERKQAEEELRESEEKFKILFENAPDAYYLNDLEGNFIEGNKAAEKLLGYKRDEFIGKSFLEEVIMPPDQIPKVAKILKEGFKGQPVRAEEFELKRKDGGGISVEVSSIPIQLKGKKVFVGIARDITERKRLEESLRQAQKMEAIGTIAGGIAHDFNNILSAIIGYSEVAVGMVGNDSRVAGYIRQVIKAGDRATDLVKQILTFSRMNKIETQPVQIRIVARDVIKLLRATLPATIEINQNLQSHHLVMADSTQIHQVLMNLCFNAAHAMQKSGGILDITLTGLEISPEDTFKYQDLTPGLYVKLAISDTGHGISPVIMERIFEPFFTTKNQDEGTGMGLSVVHGIIKNHEGIITVYSELGKGSIFNVFLPVIDYQKKDMGAKQSKPILRGTERILLVDDENELVIMGKEMLESLGYIVTTKTKSLEALELFKKQPDNFDVVITDMTMPKMTGDRLSVEVLKIRPEIPIILCTGFNTVMDSEKAKSIGIRDYIMKPIKIKDIAAVIRKVLDKK